MELESNRELNQLSILRATVAFVKYTNEDVKCSRGATLGLMLGPDVGEDTEEMKTVTHAQPFYYVVARMAHQK